MLDLWMRGAALTLPLVGGEPALPEVLGFAQVLTHPAREDEEQVAQPVHVLERPLADGLGAGERQDAALGAPADGARLVEEAAHPPAAGQDEGLERREALLAFVHQPLERRHLR